MGSFSNHWENAILDHLFGKGNYAPPVIYIGLSTSDPTDSGAGLNEPSGNGYSRVQTAETDWSVATGGLLDTVSAGNMLAYGALAQSKTISNGDTVRFASGDLSITLD
jgi:hypothetical protein